MASETGLPARGRRPKGNGPGWGGPANGAHDSYRRTALEARTSRAAIPAETLAERTVRWGAMADELVTRMHEVGMAHPTLVVPATLAFHRVTGQMPPERIEAPPGTLAAFVLIGAPEAASPEAWEAQAIDLEHDA